MASTEEAVNLFTVSANRGPLRVVVTRNTSSATSGRLQNASQEAVLLKPVKDPKFALLKRLVDAGSGPSRRPSDSGNQTEWFLPKNFSTQYESADFQETEAVQHEQNDASEQPSVVDIDGAIVEAALQSNETLNVFAEDLPRASDADGVFSALRELRNFHDVTFTKGKRVPCTWLHTNNKALAAYVPAIPFSELVENEGHPRSSHFLLWNMNDALAPETVFASIHPVTQFRVLLPNLVICGLTSGQLAVYSLATGNLKFLSDVNLSHRRPVVGIHLLPLSLSVAPGGRCTAVQPPPEDGSGASAAVRQILSAAGDGQVMVWQLSADGSSIAKLHSVQLTRAENATELSIAGLCHLENSSFAVATEEGEVALCDWHVKTSSSGSGEEQRKPELVKHISSSTRNFRPTLAFERSELSDALLLVTDFAAHVFRPQEVEPLISTPPPAAYYSCGAFSPSRAGIVYLGRVDGTLEVWDFTDQSNKPLMNFPVGSVALTCISFKADLMVVGDEQGHLHVLQMPHALHTPQARETQLIHKLLAIEERRVAHFRQRFADLAVEREEREKNDLLEKQRAQVASDSAGKGGFSVAAGQSAGKTADLASSLDDPEIKKMQIQFEALKKAFEPDAPAAASAAKNKK